MEKIGYHVFKKKKVSVKKNGKSKEFYRWYYWYIDPKTQKKVQKACPGCKNRSDAESYIRTLPPLSAGGKNQNALLKDIAEYMYIPGSAHVDRRQQLGKSTNLDTMVEARNYIEQIIRQWGELPLREIDAVDVENYLFTVKRSGSWKNRYLQIFREIYAEAPRHGCKLNPPVFETFARNSKKADKFTSADLSAFFQQSNFPDYQFFLFFLLTLSGGLRLGETRAVRLKQIIFDKKILIIDGFCKKDGFRTNYNKKGTEEDPKLRAVWLPDYTVNLLADFLKDKSVNLEDFIFTIDDKPIRQELAESVFRRALVKAGLAYDEKQLKKAGVIQPRIGRKSAVIPGGRKLVPHSLRYTYVSRMRGELSAKELQPLTGHASTEQVDYYNRKDLELIIKSLPNADAALKGLLDFTPAVSA